MMDGSATLIELSSVGISGQTGAVDLTISNGKITGITPSSAAVETVVMPLMADAHVHLDKSFTARRTGVGATSLFDAIERMEADKTNWTDEDLYDRGAEALGKAWRYGVAAMRTHVDWTTAETPNAWRVLSELRKAWRGRVDLQLASLSPIDLLMGNGGDIAKRVKSDGSVFGAFIYKNEDLANKVDLIFKLSDQYDLGLDFHVDEGLEVTAVGFDRIVENASRRKGGPSVLCGHACSLSVRPDADVSRLLGQAAEAQVGVVVLPTTNSYLQDNLPDRTPRLRGIAPMKEAAKAGVDVLIASDNVRDVFYPYGDYDLLDVFRGAVPLGHLDPALWLPAIAQRPAVWLDSDAVTEIAVGAPANFIALDAADVDDALSRPNAARRVFRDGVQIK